MILQLTSAEAELAKNGMPLVPSVYDMYCIMYMFQSNSVSPCFPESVSVCDKFTTFEFLEF